MPIAETGDRFVDFMPYVASLNDSGVVAFPGERPVQGGGCDDGTARVDPPRTKRVLEGSGRGERSQTTGNRPLCPGRVAAADAPRVTPRPVY